MLRKAGVISWAVQRLGIKRRILFLGSSWADLEAVHAAHHSLETKLSHWLFLTLFCTAMWTITFSHRKPSSRGYQCTLQTLLVLSAICISSLLCILALYLPKTSWYAGEWQFSRMTAYVNKLLLTQCESFLSVRQIITAGKIRKGKKNRHAASLGNDQIGQETWPMPSACHFMRSLRLDVLLWSDREVGTGFSS